MIRDQRNYAMPGNASSTGAAIKALVEALVPLKVDLTSAGNGADQTEDTLRSYSIAANTMGTNGVQGFRIRAFGVTGASGDNKVVKLYFGSTSVSSGTITDNAKNWFFDMTVWRSGASTQVVVCEVQHDTTANAPTVTTATETETAAILVKVTGQDSSASTANMVILKALEVTAIEQKNAT